MRAPSLKKPDAFAINTPCINAATIGNIVYLAGNSYCGLKLPVGTLLTGVYAVGYIGMGGEYVYVEMEQNIGGVSQTVQLGMTEDTGEEFEINITLDTPITVDSAGLLVWIRSSYDISDVGGILMCKKGA